jgi:hypothetical protein
MSGACYRCVHRRALAGTRHSACHHPATRRAHADPLAAVVTTMGQALPLRPLPGLNVIGNPDGIRRGWFSHPYNFDPVWLEACDGFAALIPIAAAPR